MFLLYPNIFFDRPKIMIYTLDWSGRISREIPSCMWRHIHTQRKVVTLEREESEVENVVTKNEKKKLSIIQIGAWLRSVIVFSLSFFLFLQ